MGNQIDSEIKTNNHLFANAVENSFMTSNMLLQMMQRWSEIGKPLFLIPKDFKERILTTGMD